MEGNLLYDLRYTISITDKNFSNFLAIRLTFSFISSTLLSLILLSLIQIKQMPNRLFLNFSLWIFLIASFSTLLGNWIFLTMVFGIFLMIVWILLYRLIYSSLPGNGWIKGLYFGFIIGFVKSVPEAFNQWMLINYPTPLILVQLFNTFISLMIFGALLGFFFSKFKVITEE